MLKLDITTQWEKNFGAGQVNCTLQKATVHNHTQSDFIELFILCYCLVAP